MKKLSVLLKIIEMKWNVILGVDVLQVGTKVCWVCVLGRSGSWRFHPPWVMVLRALLQRFQVWSNFKPYLGSYNFSPWMDLQHIFMTVFRSWAADILVTNPHSQQKLHQLPLSDLCIENQAAFRAPPMFFGLIVQFVSCRWGNFDFWNRACGCQWKYWSDWNCW